MSARPLDAAAERAARERQRRLAKPPGALGRLEELACWLAARGVGSGPLHPHVVVFAADHGVTCHGVSAYPVETTGAMLRTLARGGAAINVLARHAGARLTVVDVGVREDPGELAGLVRARVRAGTDDLSCAPAMTPAEAARALAAGRAHARSAIAGGARLLVAGELGIGNTTAAACLVSAYTGAAAEDVVGAGTGVDAAGLARKLERVRAALRRVEGAAPGALLHELGGLEIAAMAGLFLEAAGAGVPALLDGFIAAAAALAARACDPGVTRWLLAGHRSAERGHDIALRALGLAPLLDLDLRLGEGTGAVLALSLVGAALGIHNEMWSLAEAGVREDAGPAEDVP